MSDITTTWDAQNSRGVWIILNGALESGDDLVTATLISLFSDRRAEPTDVIPDGTTNRRGWWADYGTDGNIDNIGSRLWLLDRRVAPTDKTLNDAKNYCEEAMQWMVDDGVAASVVVQTNWNADNFLAIQVTIYKTDGTTPISLRFQLLWGEV